ncbi:hypothetical protein VQH23_02885 [Pararoseomonas sp. SCSIO 73927]|uniref:hypothetical protein n=1 Tax=Pararoseomonas sp. SCSIO 73927 TaxID=3114537 RepID=UPI0030CA94D4
MASTRHLSQEEFDACFVAPMRDVTSTADPLVDIWPYVDGLDLDTLGVPSVNDVHYVYRDALDRFDQVLIGTGRFNTLLVVVVDRELKAVHGHCLLELDKIGIRHVPDVG